MCVHLSAWEGVERGGMGGCYRINCLNSKIVAAIFSCSVNNFFVKEKRWLCQSTEASYNALVSVLRPYLNVNRLLRAFT